MAIVVAASVGVAAQQAPEPVSPKQPQAAKAGYSPGRTAWGDPDIQGTYTDKDENGIPMEKPAQFAGKSLQEVDDS